MVEKVGNGPTLVKLECHYWCIPEIFFWCFDDLASVEKVSISLRKIIKGYEPSKTWENRKTGKNKKTKWP